MYSEKPRVPWGALIVILAVLVFGCIIVATSLAPRLLGGGVSPTPAIGGAPVQPPGAVAVDIATSNTKENWMNALVENFNQSRVTLDSGEPIFVRVSHVTSGGSQQDILNGKIQPTVWSPGDMSWVATANQVWRDRTGRRLAPESCEPTVLAPIGFAMWRPMAEALGWPEARLGWEEIVELSAHPDGWASVGHPEWGQFKFGHVHPDYSNVGLLIMTALAYSVQGKTSGLTPEEVRSEEVIEAFARVEQNTYHYGIQSRDLLRIMSQRGPNYLHAVTTSEAETLKTNADYAGQLRFQLVFLFPADGTYWSDQPYCILETEWVTEEQKRGAERFLRFLLEPAQQALAIEHGLRPIAPGIAFHAPIALESGTDPRVDRSLVPDLESPSAEVAGAIQDVFHLTKKKATVILVLDTSGSMQGDKITNAVASSINFVQRLDPGDEVFVMGFGGGRVYPVGRGGRAGEVGESLTRTLSGLYAEGGTPLYDAICEAVNLVATTQAHDQAQGERRLYGIVLLSDGLDTASQRTQNQMFGCLPSGEDVEGVKIFTIAYGDDADADLLLRIANRTNGKTFVGDPESIERVYNAISAEQ